MTLYNPKAMALKLLKMRQANQPIRMSAPNSVFKEVLEITSLYEKNNPIMYVMDFVKAKIIETDKAEYDLLLSNYPNRFSKPYVNRKEIFNKFIVNIKHKIKIAFPNSHNLIYSVN